MRLCRVGTVGVLIWRVIGTCNDGELAAELGGATVEKWEIELCNIGKMAVQILRSATGQYWQANWQAERCRIGTTEVYI